MREIYKLFFKYLHAVAAIALCCTTLSLSTQLSLKQRIKKLMSINF